LEQLFALEIALHRNLRSEAPGTADASALHTSYAQQAGYEPLLCQTGVVAIGQVEQLARNSMAGKDPSDVLAAKDSLICMLGL
jgi:hypothetical protein